MVLPTTRSRVDASWSKTFDLDPVELHRPGVRVREHNTPRTAWRGLYVLSVDESVFVFTPADLTEPISRALTGVDANTALVPEWWRGVFADPAVRVLGPSVHHYLDDGTGLAAHAAGRRLNPLDSAALNALRGAVDVREWQHAGFDEEAPMLFGLFEGDELAAAANLTPGPAAASDVGVLTRQDRRGRGYGTALAATAAKQAIGLYGVARYRSLDTDIASLAVARRLGFTEYGRNLAIHLAN